MKMYRTHLLGLILLWSIIDGGLSTVPSTWRNPTFRSKNTSNEASIQKIFEMNYDNLTAVEQTLNVIYKNFFGPPPVKLSLRKSDDNGGGKSNLVSTISILGETIRSTARSIFKDLGFETLPVLNSRVLKKKDEKSLKFAVLYELMKMPLEFAPIFDQMENQVKKYAKKHNYRQFGYKKTNFLHDNRDSREKEKSRKSAVNEAISLILIGNLENCLEQDGRENHYDFIEALGKLANSEPKNVRRVLRSRLEKKFPDYPDIEKSDFSEIHVLICHTIVGDANHPDCLAAIKSIEECLIEKRKESSKTKYLQKEDMTSFLETAKFFDQTCVRTSSEDYFPINCRPRKKNVKNDELPYTMRNLNKSPILNKMAKELVATVQKSQFGRNAADKLNTIVNIYESGKKKKSNLLKRHHRKGMAREYAKISKKMAEYEGHVAKMSFDIMKNMNIYATNAEKVFVNATMKVSRKDLSGNVKALQCFSEFVKAIFNALFQNKPIPNGPAVMENHTEQTNDLFPNEHEVGFAKKSHEKGLKDWIDLMKNLRHSRLDGHSSALVAIANTFLLATMFYECIALVAAAIYQEHSDDSMFEKLDDKSDETYQIWPAPNEVMPIHRQ